MVNLTVRMKLFAAAMWRGTKKEGGGRGRLQRRRGMMTGSG